MICLHSVIGCCSEWVYLALVAGAVAMIGLIVVIEILKVFYQAMD